MSWWPYSACAGSRWSSTTRGRWSHSAGRTPARARRTWQPGRGGRLYVADTRGGSILTYETEAELVQASSTPLPGSPYGVALDPRRGELWITLTTENALVRFDVATGEPRETGRYPTVRQPNTVAVDSQSGRVYVAGREGGELQVVDPA